MKTKEKIYTKIGSFNYSDIIYIIKHINSLEYKLFKIELLKKYI